MIKPGEQLDTSFKLKIVRDGQAGEVTFAELLTPRTLVSVHMRNNTPSCDRQNDALVAMADQLSAAGFSLIAISRDTCGSHTRYAKAKGINYILASDPDDRFAQAAGSVIEKSMYGRSFLGPSRSAYVLDRAGTVLAVVEKVESGEFPQQLEHLLKSL